MVDVCSMVKHLSHSTGTESVPTTPTMTAINNTGLLFTKSLVAGTITP